MGSMRVSTKLALLVAAATVMGFSAVGCGGNACEEATATIQAKNEECGLPRGPDWPSDYECTQQQGQRLECEASCYSGTTCEAILGDDYEGSLAYAECINNCS